MQPYPCYKLDRELVFESFNGSGLLYNVVKYVNTGRMLSTKLNLHNYTKLPIYKHHPAVTMTAIKKLLFIVNSLGILLTQYMPLQVKTHRKEQNYRLE